MKVLNQYFNRFGLGRYGSLPLSPRLWMGWGEESLLRPRLLKETESSNWKALCYKYYQSRYSIGKKT